ncbi:MAG: hemolysin III, partial [Candidatus Marinimicrobia bacterium CG_4_9_14_3_um_filter_48_9]
QRGTAWGIVGFSVYGVCLLSLYLASTLYHAFPPGRVKAFFHVLDHASIYLLIAGTYTPVVLGPLRGPWGWSIFGVIWGLALTGMILKIFFTGRFNVVSTLFYVGMGWMIVVAVKPMLAMLPTGFLIWLVLGGLSYTLGVIFYLWHRVPYHHAIWHLFVLGGSICHFFGLLLYLT